jgi:hypothetical protein
MDDMQTSSLDPTALSFITLVYYIFAPVSYFVAPSYKEDVEDPRSPSAIRRRLRRLEPHEVVPNTNRFWQDVSGKIATKVARRWIVWSPVVLLIVPELPPSLVL